MDDNVLDHLTAPEREIYDALVQPLDEPMGKGDRLLGAALRELAERRQRQARTPHHGALAQVLLDNLDGALNRNGGHTPADIRDLAAALSDLGPIVAGSAEAESIVERELADYRTRLADIVVFVDVLVEAVQGLGPSSELLTEGRLAPVGAAIEKLAEVREARA